ncbi:MAG: fumarate reductase subunit C [Acidobacteria bacterium]|nr:fumarate reductase subunit C [Acidobacteriota bacterium]
MNPEYRLYHPKWHRRKVPIFWWLRKWSYMKFILRELTSLAVVYAAVLLLLQVVAVSRGEEAYANFLAFLERPRVLAANILIILGLLFHAVTWFNLAPQALVLRLLGRRIPDRVVLLAHYLGWLAVSALIFGGLARL